MKTIHLTMHQTIVNSFHCKSPKCDCNCLSLNVYDTFNTSLLDLIHSIIENFFLIKCTKSLRSLQIHYDALNDVKNIFNAQFN